MLHGLFHHHKKKLKSDIKVSNDESVKFIDRIIYLVGLWSPLVTIPQAYTIWTTQNVEGLSFITWIGYLVSTLFWLAYGTAHKIKPLIITNLIWLVVNMAVVVGLFLFR